MTAESGDRSDALRERARFLSRLDPFRDLERHERERVAASIVERVVVSGEAVLVENGVPGTELYVVREGTLALVHNEVMIDVITAGEVFGHPTLLTGLPPEFTTRALDDATLYCIPMDVALDILSRLEGVRFVARTLRERLTNAAEMMHVLPDTRTRPVTALLSRRPLLCDPDTTIREAARLMIAEGRSAILVRGRGGLGIVTDVDLRDKVVARGSTGDAAVSSIMSSPVKTIGSDVLAAEAAVAMMEAGVNHMPVVDAGGRVLGILSTGSLMSLETLSPFALRQSMLSARTTDHLVATASDVPKLFLDLTEDHLDARTLTRILTLLSDAATTRLVELAFERHGDPPVDYAWLAFGSAARSELTLASDQDNGLAYADTDDSAVDEYFRAVAEDVNDGLRRCGFALDTHGVLAQNQEWRMSASQWVAVSSGGALRAATTTGSFERPSLSTFVASRATSRSFRSWPTSSAKRPDTHDSRPGSPTSDRRSGRPWDSGNDSPGRSTSRRVASCRSRTWRGTTPSPGGSPRLPLSDVFSPWRRGAPGAASRRRRSGKCLSACQTSDCCTMQKAFAQVVRQMTP